MLKREKDGATRLEHLQAVAHKVEIPELNYPKPEKTIAYLLDYFYALKKQQGERIGYTDLKHFSEMMLVNLAAWECELIMLIDMLYEANIYD